MEIGSVTNNISIQRPPSSSDSQGGGECGPEKHGADGAGGAYGSEKGGGGCGSKGHGAGEAGGDYGSEKSGGECGSKKHGADDAGGASGSEKGGGGCGSKGHGASEADGDYGSDDVGDAKRMAMTAQSAIFAQNIALGEDHKAVKKSELTV